MHYLKLNDIKAYKNSFLLSNKVWDIILAWKIFEKDTVGKQFVRAVDSISANIAEGFGRLVKRTKLNFIDIQWGVLKKLLIGMKKLKQEN